VSNLAEVLRANNLDTLLITGTVTGVCCETTARDAMMLNFKTVMVTDGNAAMTDEQHAASLIGFYLTFGDIMSTDMLIDCLTRDAPRRLRNCFVRDGERAPTPTLIRAFVDVTMIAC